MITRFSYLLPAAIVFAFAVPGGISLTPDVERALDDVSAQSFMAHVQFLSDDALLGRQSDSEGYDTAARYVEAQYRQLGVLPAGDGATYRQNVTLRSATIRSDEAEVYVSTTSGVAKSLSNGNDFLLLPNFSETRSEVTSPLVFAGYGVSAPEFGHDDYARIDAEGKIVLLLNGTPELGVSSVVRSSLGHRVTKLQTAKEHGAAGVVFAYSDSLWSRLSTFAGRSTWGVVLPNGRTLSRSGNPHSEIRGVARVKWSAVSMLAADDALASLEDLEQIAAKPNTSVPDLGLTVRIRSVSDFAETNSPNIVGVLPGTDPDLKGTYVVHSAHLDHVGVGKPVAGDSIYNGAHDNASGVASVLEIARIYSRLVDGRPRRSVLFLMTTAEERGLLGSAYFAHHPTVPRESIVADINTDMPTLIAPLLSIVPLGAEHSTLMGPVQDAAEYLGLEIARDHMPEQVRFVRSDHFSFVQQGIPALHIKYGLKSADPDNDLKDAIDAFTKDYYHKPADQIDAPFDLEAAESYVKLNFLIGYQVAMAEEAPHWNEGDWFARYAK